MHLQLLDIIHGTDSQPAFRGQGQTVGKERGVEGCHEGDLKEGGREGGREGRREGTMRYFPRWRNCERNWIGKGGREGGRERRVVYLRGVNIGEEKLIAVGRVDHGGAVRGGEDAGRGGGGGGGGVGGEGGEGEGLCAQRHLLPWSEGGLVLGREGGRGW